MTVWQARRGDVVDLREFVSMIEASRKDDTLGEIEGLRMYQTRELVKLSAARIHRQG